MKVVFRNGDTLWRLSELFRVPLSLVVDSNPSVDPSNIAPGREIDIPGYVASEYRIRQGDTFWTIARSRNLLLESILLLNLGVNPNNLSTGQAIRIPVRITWAVVEGQRNYDYAAMTEDLSRLAAIYPFIRRRSIGSTVMGKSIPELRIGKGSKRVHVNASFHANEWITTPVLMRFLNDYLLALTNRVSIRGRVMEPFYSSATLSMVPMVNPDGVDLVIRGLPAQEPYRTNVRNINGGSTNFSGWKANIRGVDLNNQFPAEWEREAARKPRAPSPRDYPGTAQLTEPESQAMAELTRQSDFSRVLAFHTQGEVIYWGFLNLEPPESARLAAEFARVSGYEAIRMVDSYAGYKDWFIQDWRRPGFTLELGTGVNPLPISQFNEIYEESLGILLASLYA